jgi:RNA polymerase sigma factor (sigma-70 family)
MAIATAHLVLRHVRSLAGEDASRSSDADLLRRFAEQDDEAAFAELVRRHGPMVLGVCRRVLHNHHDAEDAFQATFLALARKARSIGKGSSVGSWLYQVAYHSAIRARARTARTAKEGLPDDAPANTPAPDPLVELNARELLAVLDAELHRLPEHLRAPLVLCYLQGKTRDEVAGELSWSLGTLKRRLEQGRQQLRTRLARRGLDLPAALLAAGLVTGSAKSQLPARLISTAAKSALGASAAGLAPVGISKLKLLAGLFVAAAVLFAGAGALAFRTRDVAPLAAPHNALERPTDAAEEKQTATITIRIVDEERKPIPDAKVALLGAMVSKRFHEAVPEKVLTTGISGRDGKLTLKVEVSTPRDFRRVYALVAAKGFGLGWQRLAQGDKVRSATEIKLPPEQIIRGRMVDLKGESAAGVKARVIRLLPELAGPLRPGRPFNDLMRRQGTYQFPEGLSVKDWTGWPEVVTTDAKGRFSLHGFGKGQEVHLVVEDDRFARQELHLPADKEANVSLTGPQVLEGVITYADTKKPVVNARVVASSFNNEARLANMMGQPGHTLTGKTDEKGHYKFHLYSGWGAGVEIHPLPGDPHLGLRRAITWPKGAVKQQLDLTLPPAVLVKGKVVEEASGKPLDNTNLYYLPQTQNNPSPAPGGALLGANHPVYTSADGSFQIAVPPGKGHLLIAAPSGGFAYRWVSADQLLSGTPGGLPSYHHGIISLDLKATNPEKELTVKLCRGVTIKGKVVGPDGKPVKQVAMFCPGELMPPTGLGGFARFTPSSRMEGILLKDGTFELHNCDPARTYSVFFLDAPKIGPGGGLFGFPGMPGGAMPIRAGGTQSFTRLGVNTLLKPAEGRLGAVAQLSAKSAGGKSVTVKLASCGSAEITFKNAKGKPVQPQVWLEMVVQDGPSIKASREKKVPAGETVQLSGPYARPGMPGEAVPAQREIEGLTVDASGRLRMPALIPGVTYRLKIYEILGGNGGDTYFERDFKVESGKTARLADGVLSPAGRDQR